MKLIAFFILLNFTVSLFVTAGPADSSKYKWIKGEKYLLHKVMPKETWTSIARKYDLEMEQVIKANPGIVDLKAGQIIHIPVKKEKKPVSPVPSQSSSGMQNTKPRVFHTVKQGETIYSISKNYNVSTNDLQKWNGLEGNQIKAGQTLIVGYATDAEETVLNKANNKGSERKETSVSSADKNIAEMPEPKQPEPEKPVMASITKGGMPLPDPIIHSKEIGKAGGKILSQVTESGICAWIPDSDNSSAKFFALHRNAPTGTIIKVTNKMNGKSVFVKVVGQLPDAGDNEKVIIKISESAVERLGALDQHFQVDLSYGIYK
jgi:LysM repeat protein